MPSSIMWPILVTLAILGAIPPAGRFFALVGRMLDRLSRRTDLAIAGVGALALLAAAAIPLLTTIPAPRIHDEFSYLLAGDTFAHGRLANPPHPMAEHFQTMHVLQHPTYASKYPPGQGLALAAGMVLAGEPIVGVWLSVALGCMAVCWMLFAWLPGRWALLGAVMLTLHQTVLMWSQTYWGGAVAMAGGALVAGAIRRLVDRPRAGMAVVLGFGLAILANSRPFEGFVLSLPLLIFLMVWLVRSYPANPAVLHQVLLPLVAVLGLTALAMGYYNWRVTGRPTLMPYALHDQTYGRTPHVAWGHLQPPRAYGNAQQDEFHNNFEPQDWQRVHSLGGFLRQAQDRMLGVGQIILDPIIVLLLLPMLYRAVRQDRWMRLALIMAMAALCGILIVTWRLRPHYLAPSLAVGLVLMVASLRQLCRLQLKGWVFGRGLVAGVVLVGMVTGLMVAWPDVQAQKLDWARQRMQLLLDLQDKGGKHLVLVRYLPQHDLHSEWVYNGADIDGSRVVFARSLGTARDRPLLEFFKNRQAWLLEVEDRQWKLRRY